MTLSQMFEARARFLIGERQNESHFVSAGFVEDDIEEVIPLSVDSCRITYAGHQQKMTLSAMNIRELKSLSKWLTNEKLKQV